MSEAISRERVEDVLAAFRRDRDERSFRRLYGALAPRLWAVALRLCGDPAAAEDAVQETWLRAVRDLDRFEGRSRFETWVTGILVRCCLEHRRVAARSFRSIEDEDATPTLEASSEPSGSHGALARLDAESALLSLPAGYRAVLLLHDVHGFTHAEIAAMLEVEEGTSKSQLARARRAARAALARTGITRRTGTENAS